MKWNIPSHRKIDVLSYKKRLGVSDVVASILLSMNMDYPSAKNLLKSPEKLIDMKSKIYGEVEVAKRILSDKDRIIRIFADYDVDGLMSGLILNDFLDLYEFNTDVYYPDREDGYGLNLIWSKKVIEKHPKNLTVITIDNGITSNEPIDFLKKNGANVYVIDHHEPLENNLPDADVICDAWVDRKYGTHLCAAGVALKLVLTILELMSENDNDKDTVLRLYAPFAALATISDVMPPHNENRGIVQLGLNEVNTYKDNDIINALLSAENMFPLTVKDIAWTIAPMLNACSRMKNIQLAKEFIVGSNYLDPEEMESIAQDISLLNRRRKTLTENAIKKILEENDFSNDPVVFVDAGDETPIGIIGILAGKLVEVTGKPAIVYKMPGQGSARAPLGVDIKAIVNDQATKGNAVAALGHAEACGVYILPNRIKEFNDDVLKNSVIKYEEAPEEEVFVSIAISPEDITLNNRNEINKLGYTSKEIPVLALINEKVEALPWETSSGKRHVIFKLKGNKYATAWSGLDRYEELGCPDRVNLAGSLGSGEYCSYFKGAPITRGSTVFVVDKMDIGSPPVSTKK